MAFIRSYAAQGDPLPRTHMRAGQLGLPRGFVRPRVGPGHTYPVNRFYVPSHPGGYRRTDLLAGDPFLGKMFKGLKKAAKKITLKGVVKGVGKVASFAAPLIPGVGGLVGAALAGRGGGGEPQAAPEATAPAPPSMDAATFRALIEQYIAEQQAIQEAQLMAQQQQLQAMQNPFWAGNPWGW